MASPPVTLLTRIAGRQSSGVPAFGGPVTVTPPSFTCTSYMPHPAGQGDITWKGNLFGFPAPAAGAQVQRIAVTVTHRVSDTAAFSAVTAQVLAGSTPVGSPAALTLSAVNVSDTFTVSTGYAASQLPNLAVRVNWHAVAPGLAYITSAYAEASYSFPAAITGFTIPPVASMPAVTVVDPLPAMGLRAAGTAAFSLTPAFGQPTVAGDLLVAWVYTNANGATFGTTCSDPTWLLAGHVGAAFGWQSLWYKPRCKSGETAPVFSDSGYSQPLSGLMEFYGAADLDQVSGTTGAQDITYTAPAADTRSGDLVFGFCTWNGTNTGPTTITLAGNDSSGAALALTQASNQASTGFQFWSTGWAQASAPFGPHADTMTASIGVFAGAGGLLASFLPLTAPPVSVVIAPRRVQPQRMVTVPFRAGRR
jgi:hypothetical protein